MALLREEGGRKLKHGLRVTELDPDNGGFINRRILGSLNCFF